MTVNLSGGNSNDPDGTIASYAWDLGNGQTGSGTSIQAIYNEAGSYTVSLTVTDDRGATSTQTLVIEVSEDSNIAPGADFVADTVSGTAPLQVNFDGSASADVDGTIASYAWNFGNGQNGTGVTPPAATYTFPGTYVADLDGDRQQGRHRHGLADHHGQPAAEPVAQRQHHGLGDHGQRPVAGAAQRAPARPTPTARSPATPGTSATAPRRPARTPARSTTRRVCSRCS